MRRGVNITAFDSTGEQVSPHPTTLGLNAKTLTVKASPSQNAVYSHFPADVTVEQASSSGKIPISTYLAFQMGELPKEFKSMFP